MVGTDGKSVLRMNPTNKALITVQANRFKIDGPPILVALTQAIVFDKTIKPETVQQLLNDLWADWYVECSVTGEKIALCDLRYWDVAEQKLYARPELIPRLQR